MNTSLLGDNNKAIRPDLLEFTQINALWIREKLEEIGVFRFLDDILGSHNRSQFQRLLEAINSGLTSSNEFEIGKGLGALQGLTSLVRTDEFGEMFKSSSSFPMDTFGKDLESIHDEIFYDSANRDPEGKYFFKSNVLGLKRTLIKRAVDEILS